MLGAVLFIRLQHVRELIIWFWHSDMATSDAGVWNQVLMLNRCDLAYINQSICKSEHNNFRQQIVQTWNLWILYLFTLLSSKLKYRVVDSNIVLTISPFLMMTKTRYFKWKITWKGIRVKKYGEVRVKRYSPWVDYFPLIPWDLEHQNFIELFFEHQNFTLLEFIRFLYL